MASLNKTLLIGNLGSDPDVRYMPNGNAVLNIGLATSESWKDTQGQMQERTEWHRLVMYRRLAEIAGENLKKGSQIYVEGRLKTRKWKDQNGEERYSTEIVVDEMKMLGNRANGNSTPSNQYQKGYMQNPNSAQPNQNQHGHMHNPNSMPMHEPNFNFDE